MLNVAQLVYLYGPDGKRLGAYQSVKNGNCWNCQLTTVVKLFFSIFFLALLGGCRTARLGPIDPWASPAAYSLRLSAYGYAPHGKAVDQVELAFVSNSVVAGTVNLFRDGRQMPTNLFAWNLNGGNVRSAPEVALADAGPSFLTAIAGNRFALVNSAGVQVCDESLACLPALRAAGPIVVSPDGRRMVARERSGGQIRQVLIDALSWRPLIVPGADLVDRAASVGIAGAIAPGDEAVLFARGFVGDIVSDTGATARVAVGYENQSARFLSRRAVAIVAPNRAELAVVDVSGRQLYRIPVDPSCRLKLLPSLEGTRFAVAELAYTEWNKLSNFFDIDNARPRNLLRVRVFEASSGSEVKRFEWDPGLGSISVAVSPNGRLLATERKGEVRVVRNS